MKREYRWSRIIIVVLTVLVCLIAFVNEHISIKMYGTVAISLAAAITSFVGTPVSRWIVKTFDKIQKGFWKTLFMIGLLFVIFGITLLVAEVVVTIVENSESDTFQQALSQAIFGVFFEILGFLIPFIAWLQSLLVIAFRAHEKKRNKLQ